MTILIRTATESDKNSVLKFCKNTFSWGDYVDQVWDYWLSEGSLLLLEKKFPIGICHAFFSKNQVWVEGIRVDPAFRRQNIATELVTHAELLAKEKNVSSSYMLIDIENNSSLHMAKSLDYEINQTWNFYSLKPNHTTNFDINFEKSLDTQLYPKYVKSWRWLPFDDETLSSFYAGNKIVKSTKNGQDSLAILCDSEHFDKTLIVTLFSGSEAATFEIILFLQNLGIEKNYERIQILTKENLPDMNSLELRIKFHLMKKSLI